MPTQSQLTPEVVQLAGGLDFVTPRPSVTPGALIDCYNYEVADRLGYKRVDGVEPFDGRPSISNCYNSLYVIHFSNGALGLSTFDIIACTINGVKKGLGVITNVSGTAITVAVYDINTFYLVYSGLNTALTKLGGSFVYNADLVQSAYIANGNTTITQAITDIIANYTTAYSRVSIAATAATENSLTYFNPVTGLHWFKDQLYGTVDLDSFLFDSGSAQILPNDIITGLNNSNALVRDVQLISGTWDGSAVGKILYTPIDSTLGGGVSYVPNINNVRAFEGTTGTSDGTQLSISRGSTTLSNALTFRATVSGTVPDAWYAGLERTFGVNQLAYDTAAGTQGWRDIDMGYTFPFASGTSFGPPTTPGRNANPAPATLQTASSLVGTSGVAVASPHAIQLNNTSPSGGNWSSHSSTSAAINNDLAVLNDSVWVRYTVSNTLGANGTPLILSNFSLASIPSDALVVGITVNGGAYMTNAGGGVSQQVAAVSVAIPGQTNTPTVKQSPVIASTSQTAVTPFALGGSGDTWGITNLTPANITTLQVAVSPVCTKAGTAALDFHLDYIQVVITYQQSSSIYYFWNGTNDVQAIVTNAYINPITGGSWAGNTATGVMQVAQVQPYSTGGRAMITSGDVIHSLPAGAGNAIATVSGNMTFAGLPSLASLKANSSHYEMIDANFYSNKDWSAIYGVSGAGRAFVYDSFYFRYIYTGLSDLLDIPRHLAFHNFHLCLGYQVGALLTSATGLPEDFNGVDGAGEFDTGDAITGLLRQSGTTLGIYCAKSIQALNGTDNSNFSISILSPYEGAIEYTVTDCGKPVFASYRGISTMDQTAAYGNFLGSRLSAGITPWLVPRLTQATPKLTIDSTNPSTFIFPNAGLQGPLFSQAIRAKNQQRTWFADGYYLTMTFMGANFDPVFTIQQINFGTPAAPDYLIPLGSSSAVDSTGLERNHVSYYNPLLGRATTATSTRNYVWELDRGWGWGKAPILAYFTATHNFFDNPFQQVTVRDIRLHGQSLGASTIQMAVSHDYLSNDFRYGNTYGQLATNTAPQDIQLPLNGFNKTPASLTSDYRAFTNIAAAGKTGRSFSMQFSSAPATIEPPHIAQALMVQITEGKADIK